MLISSRTWRRYLYRESAASCPWLKCTSKEPAALHTRGSDFCCTICSLCWKIHFLGGSPLSIVIDMMYYMSWFDVRCGGWAFGWTVEQPNEGWKIVMCAHRYARVSCRARSHASNKHWSLNFKTERSVDHEAAPTFTFYFDSGGWRCERELPVLLSDIINKDDFY